MRPQASTASAATTTTNLQLPRSTTLALPSRFVVCPGLWGLVYLGGVVPQRACYRGEGGYTENTCVLGVVGRPVSAKLGPVTRRSSRLCWTRTSAAVPHGYTCARSGRVRAGKGNRTAARLVVPFEPIHATERGVKQQVCVRALRTYVPRTIAHRAEPCLQKVYVQELRLGVFLS